jgi:hypothetical protein
MERRVVLFVQPWRLFVYTIHVQPPTSLFFSFPFSTSERSTKRPIWMKELTNKTGENTTTA